MRIDVRDGWQTSYIDLVVIDADTGFKIASVVACDDEEGWVIVHKHHDCSPRPMVDEITGEFVLAKLYRPIRIIRKDSIPADQRIGVVCPAMVY
jgi:hypothetical protein